MGVREGGRESGEIITQKSLHQIKIKVDMRCGWPNNLEKMVGIK